MESATLDETLSATLKKATGRVCLKDGAGGIVGFFEPAPDLAGDDLLRLSPFSDEEIEERRKDRSGTTLAAFWRKMGVQ